MSVKRYSVWQDEMFDEKHALNPKNSMVHLMVMHDDYAALEARCAALAAELSAVEEIHNEAVFITDEYYEQCPPEVQKIIRSLAVLQIPAYQAFLAEVRAQGVDMFAAVLRRKGDDAFFDAIAEAQANAADQFTSAMAVTLRRR